MHADSSSSGGKKTQELKVNICVPSHSNRFLNNVYMPGGELHYNGNLKLQ